MAADLDSTVTLFGRIWRVFVDKMCDSIGTNKILLDAGMMPICSDRESPLGGEAAY